MGLFNFFKKNHTDNISGNGHSENEIPKEIFIEEKEPSAQQETFFSNGEVKGIEAIYSFLQADYETNGFNDALTNPDDSYKSENIKLITLDLEILVQKVKTYYEDMIKELDFHITSRSRAGLIDLVEELKIRKEMVMKHIEKVNEINNEKKNNLGMPQRIILSYQRGFMRGLSAITQSNILNKKL